jgi:peptide/nickel transport system substrate-binding protein
MSDRTGSRRQRRLALVAVASLAVTACRGSAARTGAGHRGGSITIASEDWPSCLNPFTSCAESVASTWVVAGQVLPRAMELTPQGAFEPSPVLREEPTEANGGLKRAPVFTVTFRINDAAVWDDGSPIASRDFAFTWRAVLATKDTAPSTTTGYDHIESVDTRDPHTAVVRFRDFYPDWHDLFGGTSFLLKAAAFPHGADLSKTMLDTIPFSGAPWKLESWSSDRAVLVPNQRYWTKQRMPYLDRVTILRRDDPDTEVRDLVAGRVAAIYPRPTPTILDQLTGGDVRFSIGGGSSFEGIWFNLSAPPLDDIRVRQAVAYAIDRKTIVGATVGREVPEAQVLNCGWPRTLGDWCNDEDFADLTYQPAHAKTILQQDGWSEGPDGVLTKAGHKLVLEWSTNSDSADRVAVERLAAQQVKAAGIQVTFRNSPEGDLFENRIPGRDFAIANYAQTLGADPSALDDLYRSDQVPTPANGNNGGNFDGWQNPTVDALIDQADKTFDPHQRVRLIHAIDALVRHDVVWLPLYQTPTIIAWRTDQLSGPIDTAASSLYGGFANLYQWSRKLTPAAARR